MAELTAQRTLVKSPPELWAEVSEVESLAKHLGELGEIRITKTKPETTVAWEGEQISGTVVLKQSGWGTRVTFRATVPEPEPTFRPETVTEDQPTPEPEIELEPAAVAAEPIAAESVAAAPVAAEPTTSELETAESDLERESEPTPKRPGFFTRWLFRERQPAAERASEPVAEVAPPEPIVEPEPEPIVEPDPAPEVEPVAEQQAAKPKALHEQAAEAEAVQEPVAEPIGAERVQQVLDAVLENLGQAHHRPFSRG